MKNLDILTSFEGEMKYNCSIEKVSPHASNIGDMRLRCKGAQSMGIIPRIPPVTNSDNTISIDLTHGYFATISAEDTDLTALRWHFHGGYARRCYGKRTNRRSDYMHRIILARVIGRDLEPNEAVDHINGIPSDNRRSNLRLATQVQNMSNVSIRSDNTSGYKGVTWSISRGKWQAQINFNKHHKFLGYFDNPKDAAKHYDLAAIEHHGEFAKTNRALGYLTDET